MKKITLLFVSIIFCSSLSYGQCKTYTKERDVLGHGCDCDLIDENNVIMTKPKGLFKKWVDAGGASFVKSGSYYYLRVFAKLQSYPPEFDTKTFSIKTQTDSLEITFMLDGDEIVTPIDTLGIELRYNDFYMFTYKPFIITPNELLELVLDNGETIKLFPTCSKSIRKSSGIICVFYKITKEQLKSLTVNKLTLMSINVRMNHKIKEKEEKMLTSWNPYCFNIPVKSKNYQSNLIEMANCILSY